MATRIFPLHASNNNEWNGFCVCFIDNMTWLAMQIIFSDLPDDGMWLSFSE